MHNILTVCVKFVMRGIKVRYRTDQLRLFISTSMLIYSSVIPYLVINILAYLNTNCKTLMIFTSNWGEWDFGGQTHISDAVRWICRVTIISCVVDDLMF